MDFFLWSLGFKCTVGCRRFLRTEVSRERDAHDTDDDDDSNGAVEINGAGGEVRHFTIDNVIEK